jgi:hypothetical protein
MKKLSVALGVLLILSASAFAQKKTSHSTQKYSTKYSTKTTGQKSLPRSSAAPPATASTGRQTNMRQQLAKTETQSASLLAGNGGKSGKASGHALPAATLKAGQRQDRNAPIDFKYHAPKSAPVTRSATGTRSGKVH